MVRTTETRFDIKRTITFSYLDLKKIYFLEQLICTQSLYGSEEIIAVHEIAIAKNLSKESFSLTQ